MTEAPSFKWEVKPLDRSGNNFKRCPSKFLIAHMIADYIVPDQCADESPVSGVTQQ